MDAFSFGIRLLLELIPLFLIISTVVNVAIERLTPARVERVLGGGSRWRAVPLATALGSLTPFCSCSTVPLVSGMRQAGASTASLVSFLIASPLISPVAVALLWSAIGVRYAALYAASAMTFAAVGGLLVSGWSHRSRPGRLELAREPGGSCQRSEPLSLGSLRKAFAKSVRELRRLALPLGVGVAIGSLIHGYVPSELLLRIAGPDALWAVPGAALLGIPVYASIIVLLPLGSSLIAKGVGIGAVTAFLMGASGFSLPEGILLSKILPSWLLARVVAVFAVGVIAIGFLFQWIV